LSCENSLGGIIRRRFLQLFLLVGGAGLPAGASGDLVINEFLPDPEGADSGREFVELLNTGPGALDLQGVSLEFANGSEGPVWHSRWLCEDGVPLPAGSRFLLVDRNWQGEVSGQAEVWLGLQNGPDAIRLVRDGLVLDVVGYGALTDSLMMEGNPARLITGFSVARRPDGQDTGDNGQDFVPASPTPGRANFHPYDLALADFRLEPPSLDRPGGRLTVTAALVNVGTEDLAAGPLWLTGWGGTGEALLASSSPGGSRVVTWFIAPPVAGCWPLRLEKPLAETGDTLVVQAGFIQVGPAELYINEVLPAPAHGQGEWLELACQGPGPVQLELFQLKDEDGGWLALPEHVLQAGELVVVAQDRQELLAWQTANEAAGMQQACPSPGHEIVVLELPAGWPTLNNSPPENRDFADRVYLADVLGTVVDQVVLGASGDGAVLHDGTSWERLAPVPVNPTGSNWAPCTSLAGGTPGCPNSVSLPGTVSSSLSVEPPLLDPRQGVSCQHFRFRVEGIARGWWLRVFDTWGDVVRDLGGDLAGPGARDLTWDGLDDAGRPVAGGAYVVLLELRGAAGETVGREKAVTVVRRRGGS